MVYVSKSWVPLRRRLGKARARKPQLKLGKFLRGGYYSTKIKGCLTEVGANPAGGSLSMAALYNFPTFIRNSQGIVQRMPLYSKHYNRCFNLFDEYKVVGLKVQARSVFNDAFMSANGAGNNGFYPTGNNMYPLVYSLIDDDSDENITDLQSAMTSNYTRRSQLMVGKAITRKMHSKGTIDKKIWYNTSIPNPGSVPNQPDQITYQSPKRSALKYFLQNCTNTLLGWDFYIEWTVLFKGLGMTQTVESSIDNQDIFGDFHQLPELPQDPVILGPTGSAP